MNNLLKVLKELSKLNPGVEISKTVLGDLAEELHHEKSKTKHLSLEIEKKMKN